MAVMEAVKVSKDKAGNILSAEAVDAGGAALSLHVQKGAVGKAAGAAGAASAGTIDIAGSKGSLIKAVATVSPAAKTIGLKLTGDGVNVDWTVDLTDYPRPGRSAARPTARRSAGRSIRTRRVAFPSLCRCLRDSKSNSSRSWQRSSRCMPI